MKHIGKIIKPQRFLALERISEFEKDSLFEALKPKIIHFDFIHVYFEKPIYKLINNNELCGKMLSSLN